MQDDWFPYLKTLRRLPDDIVLDVATCKMQFSDGTACICGWALRATMTKLFDTAVAAWPKHLPTHVDSYEVLAVIYGGCEEEWKQIYYGVLPLPPPGAEDGSRHCSGSGYEGKLPEIERAFLRRVLEAVP